MGSASAVFGDEMVVARNGEERMGKYIDTDALECIAWNETDEGDGTFAEGVLFVLDKIASMPAADVVPKGNVRRILCGICNELHSEEPCEPADCTWMERLDNSIREAYDGNNE